jgi:hypothetical protein
VGQSSRFGAKEMSALSPGEISLAYLLPTPQQTRLALAGVTVLLFGLVALGPFATKPLPQVNGFIPALDATIFVTDFVTACLLLTHFSVTRSRAILALACGYLFSALIVIAHGLAFPGAFSPTGNFDGSRFTTFRIYLFWHLGLPASIFAYVWLREKDRRMVGTRAPTTRVAIYSVASVLALVSCIVWLGTGDELPPWDGLGNDLRVSLWLTILTMLTCATALSVLWRFRLSALDQWLMVVMVALMVELTLTALLGGLRPRLFTLGFYTGRVFSLVTSTAVLTGLLAETARLYDRLARANMLVELAHANRVATMGQLTASIAHEVNQPIAALLTNAETAVRWLAHQPPNFEKAKQSIDRIISDGRRTADIVGRIRGFSKNAPVQTENLQMNEIILEVLGLGSSFNI